MREHPGVVIGAVAGLAALTGGAAPTGSWADGVLVVGAVAVVCWVATWCRWWIIAAVAVLAAITVTSIPATGLAAAAFVIAVVGAVRPLATRVTSPGAAGALAVALAHSELDVFFAGSSVVSVTGGAIVLIGGIVGQPPPIRRPVLIAAGWLAGLAALTVGAAAIAGWGARGELQDGTDAARRAVDQLTAGDYAGAAASFEAAADDFDTGADRVDGALALPSRLVPGVAQNTDAVSELAHVAASTAADAARALRTIDPDALTLAGGSIDLAALDDATAQVLVVAAAIDRLERTMSEVSSPWLVDPLQRRLRALSDEIAANRPRIDVAVDALRVAPKLLGADGTRRYLVLFTTPAEARGLGGFSGNYAELVVDDGNVRVADFGRSGDLNDRLAERRASCVGCPAEFLDAYGIYGFDSGPNGRVDPLVWLNVTIGAHFPYVAETAANLYAEAGGHEIDGVAVMDPYVVAELMRTTGPIAVDSLGVTVSSEDVAEFLLIDQYVLAEQQDTRVDALETLGVTAMRRMLESALPNPVDLARRFGPLVDERRLLLWTRSPDEQEVLDEVGLLGALPPLDPNDGGFAVTVTNAGASKIDSFLGNETTVSEVVSDDGRRSLVAEVTLDNRAPNSGLPDYVIGNEIGLPPGTSRLIVTFYGPIDALGTDDGQPIPMATFSEAGWFGHRFDVDLASGERAHFRIEFPLPGPGDDSFDPTRWFQPLRR